MYPRTVCCGSAAIGDGVPGVSCDGATSEPREASAEERRRKGGTVTRLPSQRGRDGSGGGWGPMSSTHHPRGQASLSRSGCARDDSGEAAAMKPTSCSAPAPLGRMRQGRFDVAVTTRATATRVQHVLLLKANGDEKQLAVSKVQSRHGGDSRIVADPFPWFFIRYLPRCTGALRRCPSTGCHFPEHSLCSNPRQHPPSWNTPYLRT